MPTLDRLHDFRRDPQGCVDFLVHGLGRGPLTDLQNPSVDTKAPRGKQWRNWRTFSSLMVPLCWLRQNAQRS